MDLLAMDTGYSSVKVAYTKEDGSLETFKFPTAVAQRPTTTTALGNNKYLNYANMSFLVGEDAVKLSHNLIPTDTDDFSILYSPLLVYSAIKRIGKVPKNLCLSIAIAEIGKKVSFYDPIQGKQVEGVKEELMKEYCSSFSVNNEKIEIENIEVFPQGVGIWLDIGRPDDAIIIDIGDRTIDVITVRDRELLPYPYTFGETDVGTVTLAGYLRKAIQDEYGINLDIVKAKVALERGKIKVRGKEVSIGHLIDRQVNMYVKTILSKVMRQEIKAMYEEIGNLYVAGGGAYFFPREIKEQYGISVPESPEFSNVRGFLRMLGGEK
ncbi:ParM/StbA family protein [Desulfurobacterium sp.]